MIDAIAKLEGVQASEIVLIEDNKPIKGKLFTFKDYDKSSENEISFIKKYNYKDVVFTQQANGVWTDKVLALTNCKTLDALKGSNPGVDQIINQLGLTFDQVVGIWLTLVGLKLLKDSFDANKTTWKLVANKARQALSSKLGFTGNVDQALA